MNIFEEILAELKGLRADIKASNEAGDKWAQEMTEYQRKAMEEVLDRGRRIELQRASTGRSN